MVISKKPFSVINSTERIDFLTSQHYVKDVNNQWAKRISDKPSGSPVMHSRILETICQICTDTLPHWDPIPPSRANAGSTHPTAMLSCWKKYLTSITYRLYSEVRSGHSIFFYRIKREASICNIVYRLLQSSMHLLPWVWLRNYLSKRKPTIDLSIFLHSCDFMNKEEKRTDYKGVIHLQGFCSTAHTIQVETRQSDYKGFQHPALRVLDP